MIQRTWFPRINIHAPLAKGLVFAGLGGGASTNLYVDSSGRGNHGTLTVESWKFDSYLGRFYTSSGRANVNIPSSTQGTFSCWLRINGSGDYYQGLVAGSTLLIRMSYYTFEGKCYLYYTGGSTTLLSPDVISHFAFTWDGDNAVLYLNGVYDKAVTIASTHDITQIGNNVDYGECQLVADPIVHSRILSPSEIQQIADPSNTLLSGLILPPRRKWWPVTATPVSTFKPMQFMVC